MNGSIDNVNYSTYRPIEILFRNRKDRLIRIPLIRSTYDRLHPPYDNNTSYSYWPLKKARSTSFI